jgi:hypothetical protein
VPRVLQGSTAMGRGLNLSAALPGPDSCEVLSNEEAPNVGEVHTPSLS